MTDMKLAAVTAGTVVLAGSWVVANASGYQKTSIGASAATSVAVVTRSVHVRDGIAPIGVSCGSDSPCGGILQLQGSRTPRGLYGAASFSLEAGGQAVVNVRLNAAGRRLLKKRLQAVVSASVALGGSRSAAARAELTLSAFTVIANHWQPGFNRFWSGYAATGQKFTAVRGTFVQPSMTSCSRSNAGGPEAIANNVDIWSGLDGLGSAPIEQIGTEVLCSIPSGGTPSIGYFAWYETFPDALIGIPIAIHPRDKIFTEVRAVAPQRFAMTIEDRTTAAAWSKVVYQDAPARQLSAEWIDETQGVAPPAVTTTSWSKVSATARGVTAPLGAPPNAEITAFVTSDSASRRHVAPSALSGAGDAFSISWLPGVFS
jgi:hypothetical protein